MATLAIIVDTNLQVLSTILDYQILFPAHHTGTDNLLITLQSLLIAPWSFKPLKHALGAIVVVVLVIGGKNAQTETIVLLGPVLLMPNHPTLRMNLRLICLL